MTRTLRLKDTSNRLVEAVAVSPRTALVRGEGVRPHFLPLEMIQRRCVVLPERRSHHERRLRRTRLGRAGRRYSDRVSFTDDMREAGMGSGRVELIG